MKNIKNRIKASFNRAATTYDQHAQLQWQQSLVLVNMVSSFIRNRCNKIVDLGCGTGNSTLAVKQNFSCESLYAIDIASALLQQAKHKLNHNNLYFIETDFDELPEELSDIDLIFSNMALQWSLDLKLTLTSLEKRLSKQGVLAFSLPLKDTFVEIDAAHRNQFQLSQTVQKILQSLNFELLQMEHKTIAKLFPSPLMALRSLKNVGANCIISNYQREKFTRTKLQKVLGEQVDLHKPFNLTYKIGFFIARKRGNNAEI